LNIQYFKDAGNLLLGTYSPYNKRTSHGTKHLFHKAQEFKNLHKHTKKEI